MGSIFYRGLLVGKDLLIMQSHLSKTVATRRAASFIRFRYGESHFYQLARLATALLVGAVPSGASARPNGDASFIRFRCGELHFYQLARLAIAFWVGALPRIASTLSSYLPCAL